MKKYKIPVVILLILFMLCSCSGKQRLRLILAPTDDIGSDAIEQSALVYQDVILPYMLSDLYDFECVRVGENIQVDCLGNIKSEDELKAYLNQNFRCAWLEAYTEDQTLVFSSKHIESAAFEVDENGVESLVLELDSEGTALYERATIEHNKEKLLIYLDGVTFGECRMEKWVKNGRCCFLPDAAMDTDEKKQAAVSKIMSAAGLKSPFSVLYASVL